MAPMLNAYSVFNVAQLENLPAICNVEPEKFPDDVKLDEGSFVPQCHAAAFRCSGALRLRPTYPGPDRVATPNFADSSSPDRICIYPWPCLRHPGVQRRTLTMLSWVTRAIPDKCWNYAGVNSLAATAAI